MKTPRLEPSSVAGRPALTVCLRPLRPGDEHAAVRWAANPLFCRAADWAQGLSPRVVQRHWLGLIHAHQPDFLRLGVEWQGRMVGYVDLAHLSAHEGEFGIGIGESDLWGQGVGRQAGRLLLQFAFEELGLERVSASVHAPNTRSLALMRRLGFRELGPGEPETYQGKLVPVIWFEIRRAEWSRPRLPGLKSDTVLIRFPNIRKVAGCPSISLKPYFFHALRAILRPDMSGTQFEIV
ncbi:GNAT family N-acetyltransferase [Deinococcus taklimakanensis]|uniref:GNAT family N-acetyltransferase n=1 Tax=Deinococcus taklimakanensis TaxID=536443 RepID=A0ABW5P278_9DEIO